MFDLLAAVLVVAPLARTQSTCPLRVDPVTHYGLSWQVPLHNRANYAVRRVVLHVTFAAFPLRKYEERTFRYDILVQPRQDIVLTIPPITDVLVEQGTLVASATCRAITDEEEDR